ncbi:hypothetical protein ACRQLM_002950 [Salmonella enterica]
MDHFLPVVDSGGRFSLRALILLLLTSAFISGFLTGALAMLWFVIDCM